MYAENLWVHVCGIRVHVYGAVGCMCAALPLGKMLGACMRLLGAKYANVECMYMESFGCMYAVVGCKSMERLGACLTVGSPQ